MTDDEIAAAADELRRHPMFDVMEHELRTALAMLEADGLTSDAAADIVSAHVLDLGYGTSEQTPIEHARDIIVRRHA